MQTPTRSQIDGLVRECTGPWVSIYMPTHRRGAETAQDPIRLKNLMRSASQQLQANGCSTIAREQLLRPLADLAGNREYWQHQTDSLVAFRNKDTFELFQLDIAVPEMAIVGERPHLKPMLSVFGSDERFFVLALSHNHARLFQGTREGLSLMDVDGLPQSLDDTWTERRNGPALQSHSASGRGGGSAIFHGQSTGDEVTRERLRIYCHRIDQAIHGLTLPPAAPLILAAVDYMEPIYRTANTHRGLQPRWISGNPDSLSAGRLHESALPIAADCFDQSRRSAADRYLELWHTQRASNELCDVLPASSSGRVDTLFVAVGVHVWGTYNQDNGTVLVSAQPGSGDQDLLNLAATLTCLNGGRVYAVPPDEVPGGTAIAAVFRY